MRWILIALFFLACDSGTHTKPQQSQAKQSQVKPSEPIFDVTLESKPIILLFHAQGCKPCKSLEANLQHPRLQSLLSLYALYSIDLYAKSPITAPFATPTSIKTLRENLAIYATPTLLIFNADHALSFRHSGVLNPSELDTLLTLIPSLPSELHSLESKQQWLASRLTHTKGTP